ncbi:FKBP-type peptidyl-prolyl cis-trans isomerase [Hymenobacter sp. UYP22]|uniref:FKBP-type peptidyl-prolyl cis-trans isomerase n=1 Tax=Hymenobacter sp. UYP22 TaxID=3156348 RepID=UPI00339B0E7C
MLFSFFRRPMAWLSFCLLVVGSLLASCQKTEEFAIDTKDYSARDKQIIEDYIRANNFTGTRLDTLGMTIIETRPGTGARPKRNQSVSALYTGSLVPSGNVFDSTGSRGDQPFTFPVGMGQVIAGWDIGFSTLRVGSKAILLIPSALGYGGRPVGPIPSASVLRFDVEVKNIQ